MNYSNLSRIAINALRRNKFRAALTMLGIIIGVASVIAMLAIGQGSKSSIQDQISTMGANMVFVMPGSQQRGGFQFGNANMRSLTLEDMEIIKKEAASVGDISPEVRSNGQVVFGSKNWPTSVYGTNIEYFNVRKIKVASGRAFNDREIKTMAKVCLIGKTVVTNLFGENVDPIGQTLRFKSIPFKIIGVLSEKGQNTFGQDQDDLLIAPYTTVQRRILAITWIQGIYMSAVDEKSSTKLVTEVSEILRKRHKIKAGDEDDFRVMAQSELLNTFTSVSNILTILLGVIAGISLLVGGIGIMNIMYVSVTERTREIGLRMSVGGRGKDILMQFLIESMMLSIFGGLIGIAVGILAASAVSSVMNWPVVVTTQSLVLSFVVCSAIGIFFGWYPAKKAAGLNPIDALRYE
jgi:putative ABC transport system permease protein